jgi:hypothetical protein
MMVTRRLAPFAVAGVLLLALLLPAAPATAATVVLIRTPQPSAVASEATVRLRGELTAEGFAVRVVDCPPDTDPRAFMEEQSLEPDVEAVVAIFADSPTDAVELSVIDRVTRKTVTRRVPADPAATRSAEVLSIRALELLRASFLEIALGASRVDPTDDTKPPPPPPPIEVKRMTEKALANRWPQTWALEVGGCVFASFEGLGPTVAPMLRGEHQWSDWLVGRVTLAGLGTHSRIESESATANIAQAFGLAEVGIKLRSGQLLRPFLSLGGGVLHVTTEAQPPPHGIAVNHGLWTAIADAGAGLRVALRARFELAAEVHVQAAPQYPAFQFFKDTVARSNRPTVMGSLTLVAWL